MTRRTRTSLAALALVSTAVVSGTPAAAAAAPASTVKTCGRVEQSTGPLRKLLKVHLNGPHVLVSGTVFRGTLTVSVTAKARKRPVTAGLAFPLGAVISRRGTIVGRTFGPIGFVGGGITVSRGRPVAFPRGSSVVSLEGCSTKPSARHPNRFRDPLPAGRYLVYGSLCYTVKEPSGEFRCSIIESQPLALTVEPRSR